MTRSTVRTAGAAVVFTLLVVPGALVGAQSPSRTAQTPSRDVLLDVPYLTQTELLCGGAALVMVLRYWGQTTVAAEDFAPLVDRSEGGIRTSVLMNAVVNRGWSAVPFAAGPSEALAWLRREIAQGRPVIALLEDRPRVYHYVVVVAATPTDIVVHDPARAPYRVLARDVFERAWTAAGNWMLIVLPPSGAATSRVDAAAPTRGPSSAPATACDALVADSVAAARAGADSERGLLTAVSLCPRSATPLVELSGLRFREKRFAESADLAEQALRLAPEDPHARETLATARFLQGDRLSALEAWNPLDQPRVTTVDVEGVQQTRHPVVVQLTGLKTRQLLTPPALAHASRRLAELPTAATTDLRYEPTGTGVATVTAAVTERPVLPPGPLGWAMVGVGAVFRRELVVGVAGATGSGEAINAGYRYGRNRPRVRGELVTPVPHLSAIIRLDAMWDRQTYAPRAGDGSLTPIREERRRGGGQISDWATQWLRWQTGAAVERIDGHHYVSVDGRLNTRWWDDRLAARLSWSRWTATGDQSDFQARDAVFWWRTSKRTDRPSVFGRAGYAHVGAGAPLGLFPVASTSQSRGVLLRAHDLYDVDGVITSEMLGRRLASGTVELNDPVYISPYGTVAVGVFADVARAWDRRAFDSPSAMQIDIGGGVRIATPATGGQIRLDIAYGLRTSHTELTAAYVTPWGN